VSGFGVGGGGGGLVRLQGNFLRSRFLPMYCRTTIPVLTLDLASTSYLIGRVDSIDLIIYGYIVLMYSTFYSTRVFDLL
jgi:hypothetical protein